MPTPIYDHSDSLTARAYNVSTVCCASYVWTQIANSDVFWCGECGKESPLIVDCDLVEQLADLPPDHPDYIFIVSECIKPWGHGGAKYWRGEVRSIGGGIVCSYTRDTFDALVEAMRRAVDGSYRVVPL